MKWIKCSDQMPDITDNFNSTKMHIFFNGKKEVTVGYVFYKEGEDRVLFEDLARETNEIATHWMEMPEAPCD